MWLKFQFVGELAAQPLPSPGGKVDFPLRPPRGEMEKTEEECGQKCWDNISVRTSSSTLDVAVPLPTLIPSHALGRATFPPGEGMVRNKPFDKLKFEHLHIQQHQSHQDHGQGKPLLLA